MLLTLEVLCAEQGDCSLLHYGTADKPHHILIDGGPPEVYANTLAPRLRKLREQRGLSDGDSLPLELVVLTHIDSDHIGGLLALARESRAIYERKQPLPWRIKRLWYNSFDAVVGNTQLAALQSLPVGPAPEVQAFVAGAKEGCELCDLAGKLQISLNGPSTTFDRFVMRPAKTAPSVDLGGLSLTVLSPTAEQLHDLQVEWDKQLVELRQKRAAKGGGAVSTAIDTTPTNLSSIVLLAEMGKHRLLLTGDARADEILDGLRAAGKLKGQTPLHVDVFKVGHHGSLRNSSRKLYELVRADRYVISANGMYSNPDPEMLDMLLAGRGAGDWELCLTFARNAYKQAKDGSRRKALKEIQDWLDGHPVKVRYGDPPHAGIAIQLGDETLG